METSRKPKYQKSRSPERSRKPNNSIAKRADSEGLEYVVRWNTGSEKIAKGGGLRVGDAASTFTAALLGGGDYDAGEVLGKHPIVLTFWASWCVPARSSVLARAARAVLGKASNSSRSVSTRQRTTWPLPRP